MGTIVGDSTVCTFSSILLTSFGRPVRADLVAPLVSVLAVRELPGRLLPRVPEHQPPQDPRVSPARQTATALLIPTGLDIA
jgi:hypothetical protein